MIDPSKLTQADVGRQVTYSREYCETQFGVLSSWNDLYVFVKFKGPGGEACEPEDVSFTFKKDSDEDEQTDTLLNCRDRKCVYGYMTLCAKCRQSTDVPSHVNVNTIVHGFPATQCEMCKGRE